MLESGTCFGCGELPIGLGVVGVSILLPSGDFIDEGLFVWDAAIEALGRKDAEFARIDSQHVLHGGYECAVGLRRNDPLLFEMGLKDVFLSVRPIVLSLARSTMFSSTTLFSNNRNVQRARPLGGSEQARAISLASFSPSKIRETLGVARGLRLSTAATPSSTSCLRTR